MSRSEHDLMQALRNFATNYRNEVMNAPSDEARQAHALVDQAFRMLRETGLGVAFSFVVHGVAHWHAWIKRDDFEKWAAFRATDISGSQVHHANFKSSTTINFTYKGTPYQVKLIDGEYPYSRGERWCGEQLVLGLDLECEPGDAFPQRKWIHVFAFQVGDWMKDVLEMSAHVQARVSNSILSHTESDTISRAAQIKL